VVGPEGIGPLLGAMQHSNHVTRLLLGNNIVGDEGARHIARYIRSGQSKLDCWYIAGNEITPDGLQAVTEAIAEDPKVRHLWLKRNPLGAEGMVHLSALLKQHPALEVLDLLNCGLLDRGVERLEEGWSASQTLRHLYLDANGLTAQSAPVIARCLTNGPPLRSLFLSCNRFGEEGIRLLAPALAANTSLERLSLAANRLTPTSAAILAEALRDHPTLLHLDLGYMRGTGALGEAGNFLGDEGAKHIATLIAQNRTLRSIDLLHNDIGQVGLQALCVALRNNHQVIRLQFTQFSKAHNEYTREEIKTLLARNEAAVLDRSFVQDTILLPLHLQEIHSVYRTRV
jgi:Ran GTPase-activating protein (RanGAP) involved in mRNA processing and transport